MLGRARLSDESGVAEGVGMWADELTVEADEADDEDEAVMMED
jgi:hypothetical protein